MYLTQGTGQACTDVCGGGVLGNLMKGQNHLVVGDMGEERRQELRLGSFGIELVSQPLVPIGNTGR